MLRFLRKVRDHTNELRSILEDESYRLMRVHHHLSQSGMEAALSSVRTGKKPSDDKETIIPSHSIDPRYQKGESVSHETDPANADLQDQEIRDDRDPLIRALAFMAEDPKDVVMWILIIAFAIVIMVIQYTLLDGHRYYLFILVTLMASLFVILILKTMGPENHAQPSDV